MNALEKFVTMEGEFDPIGIRNHALCWDREIFKEKIKKYILEKIETPC